MQNQPIGDLSNELHTERGTAHKVSMLEEKLRRADEVLRESAFEIKSLREERDKLKLDYDRCKL